MRRYPKQVEDNSEGGCRGKIPFETYWKAERNRKEMARKHNLRTGKAFCVYRCSSCKKFHIGTSLRRKELK